MDAVDTLDELSDLIDRTGEVFVRWSTGPDDDARERSVDHASGLELPGLSVTSLSPPRWWARPTREWVARRVRAYAHLGDHDPDSFAWVLSGRVVDRGPDDEPLVVAVTPLARLSPSVLQEAAEWEPQSPRPEDQDGDQGGHQGGD